MLIGGNIIVMGSLLKKILEMTKYKKTAIVLIFATSILSIMNLLVCSREHLEEVENFLQVSFHISFLDDNDTSGIFLKKSYELYPEWNCEIYALNNEKVTYHPEAVYMPASGIYDIPGLEYGYIEYKGNDKDVIKMINMTCLWFKKYREYKGADYVFSKKRVYYSLEEAVKNDPNMLYILGDCKEDIKEVLEPDNMRERYGEYLMPASNASIFDYYNILITKKADKRQRLIGFELNRDIPEYICPFYVNTDLDIVLEGAQELLTLYEDKNMEFIEQIRSRLSSRPTDGGFYGDVTHNASVFNLRINGYAPDNIEIIDYNNEKIYFWYYDNLVLGMNAEFADISVCDGDNEGCNEK